MRTASCCLLILAVAGRLSLTSYIHFWTPSTKIINHLHLYSFNNPITTRRQQQDREPVITKPSPALKFKVVRPAVAVRAGASLLGRWLLPCPTALGSLSAVSWRHDLRAATNTQQLRRQMNFCSRWTSLVELSSGPAAQSRHHLRTVQTTAKETPFGTHEHGAL